MSAHVIDMEILGNSFGTQEMRAIWDERNRLQKQLDVERALALVEGELGIIPKEAAQKIAKAANSSYFNISDLAKEGLTSKHSLMATIRRLQALAGDAGEFVHYGATTQDIVDTGTMLQLKEAYNIIERDLCRLIAVVAKKAEQYKETPIAGRTHGVQALPTTFGFKLAVLLCELGRHLERLQGLKQRTFVGVVAGAVGTYASLGSKGPEMEKLTLEKLELGTPEICWHSARDRFAEYASVIALLSGTLGKIGHEGYSLMSNEVNEIEEPFTVGKIGSSTMPQKRNPAAFEGLASLTRPVFYSASLVRESMLMEHERDAMAWRAEWIALPEINIYVANQLATAIYVLEGLIVKEENMLHNLEASGGLIVAEKLMFVLGKHYGKQTAHELVYELSMQAQEQGLPFAEVLVAEPRINSLYSEAEIKALLEPRNYLGEAVAKVEATLALAKSKGWL